MLLSAEGARPLLSPLLSGAVAAAEDEEEYAACAALCMLSK